MHPITKQWYEKAEAYDPRPRIKYGWVWDYAQFRFEWASEKGRYVDEKCLSLLKLVAGIAAASWAVFVYLVGEGFHIGWPTKVSILLGLTCLVVSGFQAVRAFAPTDHLYPIAEDAALDCADRYPEEEMAKAKFCQGFAASTEYERDSSARKGHLLRRAVQLCLAGVWFLILALFAAVLL